MESNFESAGQGTECPLLIIYARTPVHLKQMPPFSPGCHDAGPTFEIGRIHSRIQAGLEEKTFKESFLLKRHPSVSNDLRPLLLGWTTTFFSWRIHGIQLF